MQEVTFRQRAGYWFDNVMARGTPALIALLAIASIMMIFVIALVVVIIPGAAPSVTNEAGQPETADFNLMFWMGLLRTLDSGTMGADHDISRNGWFLGAMLVITLGGIFVVSALIGVITTGLDAQLEKLRKGRSAVIERDYTLILGWSEQIFTIIGELVQANANRQRPCIVILADKDKVEMEEEVATKVPDLGKTRVICRSGSPIDLDDLAIVNPNNARSIIVLAPGGEDPDSQVIKTILAITNNPKRRKEPYHIVAEIQDTKNMEAARLVGGDEAQLVEVGDTVARLIAQTCRQSGLSVIYTELLDFGGDEIYFQEEPKLVGRTYADALTAYEKCAIMGLRQAGGAILINPPMNTPIAAGDQVIAVAEDDDKVVVSGLANIPITAEAIQVGTPAAPGPERTLILGWNSRAPKIVNELDSYVAPGSTVTIVADWPTAEEEITRECAGIQNITVEFQQRDTTARATLDELHAETYQHIIVLCYSESLDAQRADAKTLITLLHLRDIESRRTESFSIVSEMLDDRNRALAEVTKADDFIVSDKLISLLLSQVSENKYLRAVFADIFDPEGSEIYIRPIQDYIRPGTAVNFYTVVESARRRNETALGYIRTADAKEASKSYGVALNPAKSELVTFAPEDKIVVLAEG